MRQKKLLIMFSVAILLKLSVIAFTYCSYGSNVYVEHYANDLDGWFDTFGKIEKGLIPLVDFPREYPSGAVSLHWALSFLYSQPRQFLLVYGLFMLVVDMAVAGLLWRISNLERRPDASMIVGLYLFLPTILILNHVRFDIVPAFFAVLAYYYWRKGGFVGPAVLLGVGMSIKWFTIFMVAAIFLNEVFEKKRLRRAIGRAAISIAAFVAMDVPYLLTCHLRGGNFTHWSASYTEQYGRWIGVDTLAGIIQMLSNVRFSSGFLFGVTLTLFLLIVFFRTKKSILSNYILYCFAFLLFNKAYSPQFHIWFLPFLLLCIPSDKHWGLWRKAPMIGIPALFTLEAVNMLVYPLSFVWFLQDVGRFAYAPFLSVRVFSGAIILRTFLLLWIGWGLWKRY